MKKNIAQNCFDYSILNKISEVCEIDENDDKSLMYNFLCESFDHIIDYIDKEFKSKTVSIDQLSTIFVCKQKSSNSLRWSKDFLRKNLYCLGHYIKQLRKLIQEEYIDRYKTVIRNLLADLDAGICMYEKLYKNIDVKKSTYHRRVSGLSSWDLWCAMRELFFIESAPDIKDSTLRGIKPNVIFIIRQFLELKWKRVIGFECICNAKDKEPIHKFTQAAWDFISNEHDKKVKWHIYLPPSLTFESLDKLNKWANSFVHEGVIYADHIQFLALEMIAELMMISENPSNKKDNPNKYWNTEYGNICITGYNYLKSDFEKYIKKRMCTAEVQWLPESCVEAYIVT